MQAKSKYLEDSVFLGIQSNWCFFYRLQIFKQEQFYFPGHLPLAF